MTILQQNKYGTTRLASDEVPAHAEVSHWWRHQGLTSMLKSHIRRGHRQCCSHTIIHTTTFSSHSLPHHTCHSLLHPLLLECGPSWIHARKSQSITLAFKTIQHLPTHLLCPKPVDYLAHCWSFIHLLSPQFLLIISIPFNQQLQMKDVTQWVGASLENFTINEGQSAYIVGELWLSTLVIITMATPAKFVTDYQFQSHQNYWLCHQSSLWKCSTHRVEH